MQHFFITFIIIIIPPTRRPGTGPGHRKPQSLPINNQCSISELMPSFHWTEPLYKQNTQTRRHLLLHPCTLPPDTVFRRAWCNGVSGMIFRVIDGGGGAGGEARGEEEGGCVHEVCLIDSTQGLQQQHPHTVTAWVPNSRAFPSGWWRWGWSTETCEMAATLLSERLSRFLLTNEWQHVIVVL